MSLAVFNAGSSSLKFALYDDAAARCLATGSIDWAHGQREAKVSVAREGEEARCTQREVLGYGAAIRCALEALGTAAGNDPSTRITAVGQRVVHGGTRFWNSVRIDAAVRAAVVGLTDLAPLHNPPALEAIDAVASALPEVPQVAVFDTAFYASLTPAHFVFPVPYRWYEEWGVRRFGFHGISHGYCNDRARELLRGRGDLRIITCHLGNGCSATATRAGTAVATSMGLTPLDGLMMGTRPGSLDPGILLYVQQRRGLGLADLDRLLNHEAGLQGVSGVASDYREVERAAEQGHARARLALDIYAVRVREAVGALAVTLGGIDALVFTAGVGEHSASLRAAVCQGLGCLGLHLDPNKNAHCTPDADVATASSAGRILVIHTQEELMIAREVCRVLRAARV